MKRVVAIFVVLVVGLSVGLWTKVRQTRAAKEGPAGGAGVIEGLEVEISARIPARIARIAVQEGDRVKRGQLLAELDCREQLPLLAAAKAKLAAAQAQAAAAQAQVVAALGSAQAAKAGIRAAGAQRSALQASRAARARQVGRLGKLRGEGGATEADLDRATTQVEQLKEQIAALQAKTLVARSQARAAQARAEAIRSQAAAAAQAIIAAQADVRRAQNLVDECRLTAPIDGAVLVRAHEPGEVVLPGSRLLTLVRLDEVETIFYLPNRDLSAGAPGRPVRVEADAYPGTVFRGKIRSVAAEAEFTPRNIQTRDDRDRLVYAVRVTIPNREGKLRPGMPVEVRIARGDAAPAVAR